MIRIEGLTIHFDTFKITDLHIRIEEGEFHFLLGPTGSGKTLILESIMGLRKPKKGKISIGEREIQDLSPERREISYVPQDLALFPHLRVKDNILFGIRARHLDMQKYRDHVDALIEVTRLGPLLERYPASLSGGEKKRVALLRALAPRPKLLLLDEPLSGLDPSMKAEIQQLLKTLQSSFHPTTLCVTHDFEEAYFLGDEITICIDGKVEQSGRRDEVFLKPRSRKVAHFLGAKNVYRARVLKKGDVAGHSILGVNGLQFSIPLSLCPASLQVGQEVDLFIRPEEVMIIREGKPVKDSLRHNLLKGRIRDIVDRGRYHLIYFETIEGKIPFEISIPNYAFRNLDLSRGKVVRAALREESLWLMF